MDREVLYEDELIKALLDEESLNEFIGTNPNIDKNRRITIFDVIAKDY